MFLLILVSVRNLLDLLLMIRNIRINCLKYNFFNFLLIIKFIIFQLYLNFNFIHFIFLKI